MRLFVAIQLSDEIQKSITASMHDLKKAGVKGSFVPAQNLHLTLAFIGETDNPGAVRDALKNVSFKPFKLSLSDMGTFDDTLWVGAKLTRGGPARRAGGVLCHNDYRSEKWDMSPRKWWQVRGNQGLSGAAKSVRDALTSAGIPCDQKKFVPHITLIRRMTGPWKKVPAPKGEMMVKKISLMKTTFKDGKPVYSEVCSI